MAARRSIYHNSSLTSEVRGWRAIGENVGRGDSASQVHGAFMGSGVHRTHILDRRYNQIGTGAVRGGDGLLYVAEVFAQRSGGVSVSAAAPRRRASVVVTRRPAVRRHRPPARVVIVVEPPNRSVLMLLRLLAIDASYTVRKDIPSRSGAS